MRGKSSWTILVVFTAVSIVSGCKPPLPGNATSQSSAAQKPVDKKLVKQLQAFADAYRRAHDNHGRGLNSWEEFQETYPSSHLPEEFENYGYAPIFGVNYSEMKVGQKDFILAHPKAAASEGGLVLVASGDVKRITAEEFRHAFPSQMQGVATWPHELVEVGEKEEVRVGDEFYIPRVPPDSRSAIGAMMADPYKTSSEKAWETIKVKKALPSGEIEIATHEGNPVTGIIYERWQLRRLVPLADRSQKPRTPQDQNWQTIIAQRQAKLMAALEQSDLPKHDLMELEPQAHITRETSVWARWGEAMREVRLADGWSDGRLLVVLHHSEPTPTNDNPGRLVFLGELRSRMIKPAKEMYRPLKLFADAYKKFLNGNRRPAESWQDIGNGLEEKFAAHSYGVQFSVNAEEMTGRHGELAAGELPDSFLLAYPEDAAEKGGLVLTASGELRELSAEDFRTRLAAQMKRVEDVRRDQVASALRSVESNRKLVPLADGDALNAGDIVFVPVHNRMQESTVTELRANGRIVVKVGRAPAAKFADDREIHYFSRSQVLKLPPPPSPPVIVDTGAREAERLALRTQALERMFALYVAYTKEHRNGPERWEDLGEPSQMRQLREATYGFFPGMMPQELKAAPERVLLAFPDGGEKKVDLIRMVLFADGSTRIVTAEELTKLKKTSEAAWVRTPSYEARAKKNPPPSPLEELLTKFRNAYLQSADSKSGHGPSDWDELELRGAFDKRLRRQFATAGYEAIFNLGPRDLPRGRGSFKFIIAYPKGAPQRGGLVVLHDGVVKEMSAEEFNEAAAKQTELLKSRKP